MTMAFDAIYRGIVTHKRLRPVHHALNYRVFAILFDCSALAQLDKKLRLFSYNRFNLVSLFDRDHGDGTGLTPYLTRIAERANHGDDVKRFVMLCYPRILGYAFNPLTVFYGLDAQDRVRLVIYEVNNTFGERRSYVLPVDADSDHLITQNCKKQLYVSPFNSDSGHYSFHLTPPNRDLLTVGVALKDEEGPLLKAYFRGNRRDLTDAQLLRALGKTGWMTLKVTLGIHYEACKLWLKGLKFRSRPRAPAAAISFLDEN